jgi:uncharacterized protein YegL
MSQKTVDDVKSLFQTDPNVDETANALMINSLNGTNLVGCLGTSIDDIETDDVTIVKVLLDSSYSMHDHEAIVRDAYDKFINSLKGSKQSGSILVSTVSFAGTATILHGFKKVDEIDSIGNQYIAKGYSTALYDALMDALTGAHAYATDLKQNGVRVKIIVVVFSDGYDNDSKHNSAKDVKTVVDAAIKKEGFYPVYVGYKQSSGDDLNAIAKQVGFPNVMVTNATESEIRRTIDLVSKSIIRTSQTTIGGTNNSFFQ